MVRELAHEIQVQAIIIPGKQKGEKLKEMIVHLHIVVCKIHEPGRIIIHP